jgi:hypothetical protein
MPNKAQGERHKGEGPSTTSSLLSAADGVAPSNEGRKEGYIIEDIVYRGGFELDGEKEPKCCMLNAIAR